MISTALPPQRVEHSRHSAFAGPQATRSSFFRDFWRRSYLPGLVILLLDIATWAAISNGASYMRQDGIGSLGLSFHFLGIVPLCAALLVLFIIGGYDRRIDMQSLGYLSEHLIGIVAATSLTALVIYSVAAFDSSVRPSRGVLLCSFAAFLPLSLLYRRAISHRISDTLARRDLLVLGTGPAAVRFYLAYRASPQRQRLRFFDADSRGANVGRTLAGEGTPLIEGALFEKLSSPVEGIDGVIIAEESGLLDRGMLEKLARVHFGRTRVYTLEAFYESFWRRVPVHTVDPMWPLQTGFQLARRSPYAQLKRLVDMAGSAGALLLLSPLLVLIAFLVWCFDGRPIFFRQTRVGREERPFTIVKFRTMSNRAPEEAGSVYTQANDTRITLLGRLLRKLRLDELPQLWNVLKGDMSLIGPRAEWTRCVEDYETRISCYHFRHLVKPGITGWAQVNYPYGESFEDAVQKLKYDLYYVRHCTLKLDAMIVLKTLHTILAGKGR